jgi:RHS repeat-associated protein
MVTDASGNVVSLHDFLPFGEEIQSGTDTRSGLYPSNPLAINDAINQKFTGKERDGETGNDHFGARYLSSTQMRWIIADWSAKPEGVPYSDAHDPQTLNLYGYLRNDPLSRRDPDGHQQQTGPQPDTVCTEYGAFCRAFVPSPSAHGQAQKQARSVSSGTSTTVIHANGSMERRRGNIAFRDNNPGDLRPGPFSEAHGQIGVDVSKKSGRFAVFENSLDGEAALRLLLATPRVQKRSILEEMMKFAPAKDGNDPVAYANTLAAALGVGADAPMSSLTPAKLDVFVEKVKQVEGFNDPTGSTVRLSGTVRLTQ